MHDLEEAIKKVAAWLEKHRGGCGWGMSPRETAEYIFKEGDYDEDPADAEVPVDDLSE